MSKLKKRLLIIIGIITIILIVLVFSFNAIVAYTISNKVDNYLAEHPVKNYQIEYDRIGFNFLNRSARIIGLTYTPNDSYVDSMKSTGFKAMIPEVKVGRFIVSGINIIDLIKNKEVIIDKIKIKNVKLTLNKIDGKTPDKKKKIKLPATGSLIPDSVKIKGLNKIVIDKFLITNSKVEIYNLNKLQTELTNKKINFTIDGIKLDKKENVKDYLFVEIKDMLLEIDHNVFRTPDNLYEITFDKLSTTFRDEAIAISNFHFKPLYSKTKFSKHIKYQQERYDIKSQQVLISHPNYKQLIQGNELDIQNVTITKPDISIYRDKRLPFPHFKRPLLPHQALKRMALQLKVDSVQIVDATFVYEEKTDRNSQTLYLDFQKLSGIILNVNNTKEALAENDIMKVSFKGRLMGKAPFDIDFRFPMKAKNDTFVFSGTVYGKVPFEIFNKAVFPAAGVRFDDGTLNKLTFKGGANPKYSKGSMTLLYDNLNLHIVKSDEVSKNKFLSWSASAMVRKNNPSDGDPPKVAYMVFERDIEKGFGNFLWKTILSGLKGSMIVSMNTINKNKYNSFSKVATSKSRKNKGDSENKKKKKKKWFWQNKDKK
jgi:hypothetical protein